MVYCSGAILVFLPGYDEIITLRDRIQDDKRFSDSNRLVVVRSAQMLFVFVCMCAENFIINRIAIRHPAGPIMLYNILGS